MVTSTSTPRKAAKPPDIQLIANAVISDGRGRVLLTRYDDDKRWWLPGAQLKPYEHPDEALQRALADVASTHRSAKLHHVESFRGRRGWHVMFNHLVKAPAGAAMAGSEWFAVTALPPFSHGAWERGVVLKVLG